MKCNKCKSSNVQKFQVIHEQGTSNINLDSNTVGGGIGFGGGLRGGVGLGRTGTSGKSQTLLAKKTEPPKDLRLATVIPILVIGLLFYAGDKSPFYYFFSYCVLALILFIFSFKRGSEVYEVNYQEWLNKWYCNKCGNSFLGK
jgi:hypothetical protein